MFNSFIISTTLVILALLISWTHERISLCRFKSKLTNGQKLFHSCRDLNPPDYLWVVKPLNSKQVITTNPYGHVSIQDIYYLFHNDWTPVDEDFEP